MDPGKKKGSLFSQMMKNKDIAISHNKVSSFTLRYSELTYQGFPSVTRLQNDVQDVEHVANETEILSTKRITTAAPQEEEAKQGRYAYSSTSYWSLNRW